MRLKFSLQYKIQRAPSASSESSVYSDQEDEEEEEEEEEEFENNEEGMQSDYGEASHSNESPNKQLQQQQ